MRRSTETGVCLRCEEAGGAGTVEIERGKLLMGVDQPSGERAAFHGEHPAAALPLAIP